MLPLSFRRGVESLLKVPIWAIKRFRSYRRIDLQVLLSQSSFPFGINFQQSRFKRIHPSAYIFTYQNSCIYRIRHQYSTIGCWDHLRSWLVAEGRQTWYNKSCLNINKPSLVDPFHSNGRYGSQRSDFLPMEIQFGAV